MKADTASGSIYSEQDASTTSVIFKLGLTTGGIVQFQFHDGASWQTNSSISSVNNNQWHLLTGTFSTTDGTRLYIDGKLDSSNSGNTNTQTSSQLPTIGALYTAPSTRTDYFEGQVDDITIYNYRLTPAQVAWNYNQGKPIGHWKLNECQGNTAYDSGTGGNNGTITIGGTGDNQTAGTCSSGTGTEAWNNGTNGKVNASLDFDGTDDHLDVSDLCRNTVIRVIG